MSNKFRLFFSVIFILINIDVMNAQWVETSKPGDGIVSCFFVSGTNLFVGTRGTGAYGGGVFLSTDSGANWTSISPGNNSIYSLICSGTNLFAGASNGVYLSTNNGLSWLTPSKPFEARALAISDTSLFAGSYGGGVVLSTDNGASWTSVNTGLNTNVYSLASLGKNILAGVIGAISPWGVFLTTNNGISWAATWTDINGGIGYPVYSMSVSNTNIFAGTENGGVFISSNDGKSWNAVNNGLIERDLYYLASYKQYIFAGSSEYGYGVFFSIDNGNSWTNSGLTQIHISSLAVNDKYLFAGTESGTIWKRPLSDMIPVHVEDGENNLPEKFSLKQNYPNPFNPSTTINYSIAKQSNVTIKIYDLLGRELVTLVNEEKPTGNYAIEFNASSLTSGIYFYQLKAGNYKDTKKLVLLK
jgi:hypothetical protein